jgi:DNA-binding NarL/FixJ family response regulator
MGIRILLAEDHKIVRQGLRSLLERESDLEIVAEAENGAEAIALAAQHGVELVLMDLTLPDMSGIEATRRIVAELPGVLVIALTMHSDKRYITETFKAGARGYLVKDGATLELVEAIRAVVGGASYLSRSLSLEPAAGRQASPGTSAESSKESCTETPLSPREREVLQKIAEGKSTKEIAYGFGVSIKTIETQRSKAMKKLNLSNMAQLTKYAIREGLVSL